jgi:hypothetical protein
VVRGEEDSVVSGEDRVVRLVGTGRRIVHWVEANRDRVTRILKNPTYAGAIVNGRRKLEFDRASGRKRWVTRRAYENCTVIQNAHDGYITWDEHLKLLASIARNNQVKTYSTGEALLSGLGLLRCGVCNWPMVVSYNNPVRHSRGRAYRNTPYTYTCSRRTPEGAAASCQSPAGPYLDQAVTDLVLFGLGELDLAGLQLALSDRHREKEEMAREQRRRVEVLSRRARTLEEAIADAARPEARTRLVGRFEEALAELDAAEKALAAPSQPDGQPGLSRALVATLEPFRDPGTAWARFAQPTQKEVIRALAAAVIVFPIQAGYVVVVEWVGGGRAAAEVHTIRRKKFSALPDDVLALFSDGLKGEVVIRREEARA